MTIYYIRKPADKDKARITGKLILALRDMYELVVHDAVIVVTDGQDGFLDELLAGLAEHVVVTLPKELTERIREIKTSLKSSVESSVERIDQVDQVLEEMFPAPETKVHEIYSGLQKVPLSEIPVSAEQLSAIGGTVDEDGTITVVQPADGKKARGGRKRVEAQPCKECGTMTTLPAGYCSARCYNKAYQRKLKAEKGTKTPEPERHPANIETREPKNQPAKTEADGLAILGFEPHAEYHGSIKAKRLG